MSNNKIFSVKDLNHSSIEKIFFYANEFRDLDLKYQSPAKIYLQGSLIATLFLEPSTRTRLSFETAAIRLGAKIISVSDAKSSSVAKGESLYDTLMTVGQYADVIVVRTSSHLSDLTEGQKDRLPKLINAGDGDNQHPTQALLDAYTIKTKLGRLTNLKIGICGDLLASRSIRSFMEFFDETVEFVVLNSTSKQDISKFESNLGELDVLYLNRIQRERHDCSIGPSSFCLNEHRLNLLNKDAIILNPGPRLEEMPEEFDSDPRNLYWEQMKNGLYVRMALLTVLCKNWI